MRGGARWHWAPGREVLQGSLTGPSFSILFAELTSRSFRFHEGRELPLFCQ